MPADDADDVRLYEVRVTDEAFYQYASIRSDRLFEHVTNELELLETSPELGRAYDPVYDAQKPPFECRVLFCEHLGIYYRLDEAEMKVIVFSIVDQRRNLKERFEYYISNIEED